MLKFFYNKRLNSISCIFLTINLTISLYNFNISSKENYSHKFDYKSESESSCHEHCSGKICNSSNNCANNCSGDFVTSRTIFIPRSLTTDSALDLPLGNYQFYHNTECPEDKAFFDIQASYFHLSSRKEAELAAYFLPNGRRCITVLEDGEGDVGSLWLGLISSKNTKFSSKICLSPKRKVDGGFFNFYFDFNTWFPGSWLSIAFAAFRSEQTLGIKEQELENKGILPGLATVIQALNNKEWTAGIFYPKTMVRGGVDDVQFKLGWNYYFCNQDHLGLYFVATAPTGNRLRNKYIFEPIVGHRHGSAGIGYNSDYTIWDSASQALHWMIDLKYRYEFTHCTRRLFDLCKNGPWSRYLLVVKSNQRSMPEPAVNYFARNVAVTSGNTIDLWTCLHYNWYEWNFEIGYDLYWRQNEKLCLKNFKNRDLKIGIYDISGDCLGDPVSASNANITETVIHAGENYAPSNPTFVTVKLADLNLASGTRPKAFSNTIYAAFSYNYEMWHMPIMLGFVGMYEIADGNTTFEQWGVQVRSAISF